MEQMNQRLQEFRDHDDANCRNLVTQLERLETNWRRAMKEDESRNDSRSPSREQAQLYNSADTDAQYIKSVKVDALFFNGRLDPQSYIDWQLAMDHYFCWQDMFEFRKIRFAMMKLTGQAEQYWKKPWEDYEI